MQLNNQSTVQARKIFEQRDITVIEYQRPIPIGKEYSVSNGELEITLDYCPILNYENLQSEIFERFLIKAGEDENQIENFWLNVVL